MSPFFLAPFLRDFPFHSRGDPKSSHGPFRPCTMRPWHLCPGTPSLPLAHSAAATLAALRFLNIPGTLTPEDTLPQTPTGCTPSSARLCYPTGPFPTSLLKLTAAPPILAGLALPLLNFSPKALIFFQHILHFDFVSLFSLKYKPHEDWTLI